MNETELLPPIHPGEILAEEFLDPLDISPLRLAHDIGVPHHLIDEILHGRRGISADTALRLSRYFGLSERFWMNLQGRYNLVRDSIELYYDDDNQSTTSATNYH